MASKEEVAKAVETLKGFKPEVLEEAILEIPEMWRLRGNNINVSK